MSDKTDEITERKFQITQAPSLKVRIGIPQAASIIAVLTGCKVLVGCGFGIELFKRVVPGLVAMNTVTALTFILLGSSLWLSASWAVNRRWLHRVAQGCGVVVALTHCLT